MSNIILCFCASSQVIAYNSEGKSNPSEIVEFTTCPDKPGVPIKPSVKGKIHSHSFKITWGKILCIFVQYSIFD